MENTVKKTMTKEEVEQVFVKEYGDVAKVFLAWKDSLGEKTDAVTLRSLDTMIDVYKRNERNVGLLPNIVPDVDLSNYQILFKELDKFKIQQIRDNSLGNNTVGNKLKNN